MTDYKARKNRDRMINYYRITAFALTLNMGMLIARRKWLFLIGYLVFCCLIEWRKGRLEMQIEDENKAQVDNLREALRLAKMGIFHDPPNHLMCRSICDRIDSRGE